MRGGGIVKYFSEGKRLLQDITFHKATEGGSLALIAGSMGSGKTTFLVELADRVASYDRKTKKLMPETIVWRGREFEYFTWFEHQDRVHLFFHEHDNNEEFGRVVYIRNEDMEEDEYIDPKSLPPIHYYKDADDLMHKLVRHCINVVWEPHEFDLSVRMKKALFDRSGEKKSFLNERSVNPTFFWFEFFELMLRKKSSDFVSVFVDEADDLMPGGVGGLAWHMNALFKDSVKDFRKRNVSLYLAMHNPQDVDGRIPKKFPVKIYFKGAHCLESSIIDRAYVPYLDRGYGLIEKDAFGAFRFDKLPDKPKLIVDFEESPELQDKINAEFEQFMKKDVPDEATELKILEARHEKKILRDRENRRKNKEKRELLSQKYQNLKPEVLTA